MAAVRHLEFLKFAVCHVISNTVLFCLPIQNFNEIGQSAAELWPKTILNMAAARHLEFIVTS